MAEAVQITHDQLQEAVSASLKRAVEREGRITRPILIGIIAYPEDGRLGVADIQVAQAELGK